MDLNMARSEVVTRCSFTDSSRSTGYSLPSQDPSSPGVSSPGTGSTCSSGVPLSPESGRESLSVGVSSVSGLVVDQQVSRTDGEAAPVSRPHVLPPCKVCGAQATGFHYGANTCEACKGFFRRSLLRSEEYVCVKNVKCIIRPGKRNMCAACRYQRCLAAGMSKDGIKTGRYTYEKRTKDILELKQLHTQECQKKVLTQKEEIKERAENLIQVITEAQQRHHVDSTKNNSIVPFLQDQFLEQKRLQETLFGPTDTVSEEEFKKTLHTTGIELDDRREVIASWIGTAERGLRQMVGFAKDLPGFKSLPLDDQIKLLKNSIAEAWLITRHKYINVEHGCYTAHCGYTFDLCKALDKELLDSVMAVTKRLQQLELTFTETCVLKAMAFFFSDRCPLKEPAQVDHGLKSIMEALEYLLEKNHPDTNHMIARIILIMTDLRNVTEQYHKHNEKILQWTDMESAPLLWEVLTCSRSHKGNSDAHKCKDQARENKCCDMPS